MTENVYLPLFVKYIKLVAMVTNLSSEKHTLALNKYQKWKIQKISYKIGWFLAGYFSGATNKSCARLTIPIQVPQMSGTSSRGFPKMSARFTLMRYT